MPQTRGQLSKPELAVSALSRTLERRYLLSNTGPAVSALSNPELAVFALERWTGGVGSLSNPDCLSSGARLLCSRIASFSRLNPTSDTK